MQRRTWLGGRASWLDATALEQSQSKGVVFEHYDMRRGMTRDGDVCVSGDMKVAWFKDPDGNLLNVAGR